MIFRRGSSDKSEMLLTLYNKNYFECIHREIFNGFLSLVLKSKVSKTKVSLRLVDPYDSHGRRTLLKYPLISVTKMICL